MSIDAQHSEIISYLARVHDCRPMQTKAEQDAATRLVESLGLKSHHDRQKNWDTFKCLSYLNQIDDRSAAILDAGSGTNAVVVRWLHELGYRNLHACDLQMARSEIRETSGIQFRQEDLTKTSYAAAFFEAVTCISVIEHNIPYEAFAVEMARILKPGGMLLLSTDYWPEPIDCTGIFPYGVEAGQMKILDRAEIKELIDILARAGFEPMSPIEFEAKDKVVHWERVNRDYTFAFLAFRKR